MKSLVLLLGLFAFQALAGELTAYYSPSCGCCSKYFFQGAVKRIGPKSMTLLMVVAGLLPAVYLQGTGAEVILHMALPMLGGVVSSFLTALFALPALYTFRR